MKASLWLEKSTHDRAEGFHRAHERYVIENLPFIKHKLVGFRSNDINNRDVYNGAYIRPISSYNIWCFQCTKVVSQLNVCSRFFIGIVILGDDYLPKFPIRITVLWNKWWLVYRPLPSSYKSHLFLAESWCLRSRWSSFLPTNLRKHWTKSIQPWFSSGSGMMSLTVNGGINKYLFPWQWTISLSIYLNNIKEESLMNYTCYFTLTIHKRNFNSLQLNFTVKNHCSWYCRQKTTYEPVR